MLQCSGLEAFAQPPSHRKYLQGIGQIGIVRLVAGFLLGGEGGSGGVGGSRPWRGVQSLLAFPPPNPNLATQLPAFIASENGSHTHNHTGLVTDWLQRNNERWGFRDTNKSTNVCGSYDGFNPLTTSHSQPVKLGCRRLLRYLLGWGCCANASTLLHCRTFASQLPAYLTGFERCHAMHFTTPACHSCENPWRSAKHHWQPTWKREWIHPRKTPNLLNINKKDFIPNWRNKYWVIFNIITESIFK